MPKSRKNDCSPKSFSQFFDEKKIIKVEKRGTFQVYQKGQSGLTILAIHSFGSSALTWSLFAKAINALIDCQIFAIDLRDHGNSFANKPGDLSLKTLTEDIQKVVDQLFPSTIPNIQVIGHSLGGSIGLQLATLQPEIQSISIVDGTERDCLDFTPELEKILNGRTQSYNNLDAAIFDYVKLGFCTDFASARVVVPSLMFNLTTHKTASEDVSEALEKQLTAIKSSHLVIQHTPLRPSMSKQEGLLFKGNFIWRNTYKQGEKFYKGWYEGLSERFLSFPGPKLLLLTQDFHLDTKIEEGMVQNKLQCDILPRRALLIQESDISDMTDIYKGFLLKHKIITQQQIHKKK